MTQFRSARLIPWIFAAKTTAAGLIALLVAFTFNLDQPQWALLTVFIVSQPRDGLVLAKSFYRIIGTCIGAAGALVLVALFAQERVLFLGALALWIGVCTFGSQYARNWAAYGLVLSGYTVAIVGIPGALDPANAFYIATARVSEISLGIATAATISHVVLPMSLASSLRQAIAAARVELGDYIIALLVTHDGMALRTKLLGRAVAIQNLRASAVFEDRAIRDRAGILTQLGAALIDVISVTQILGRQVGALDRSSAETGPEIDGAIAATRLAVEAWRAGNIDGAGLGERFRRAEAQLPSARDLAGDPTVPGDMLMQGIAVSGVLREFFAAMAAYAAADEAFVSAAPRPPRRADFARANDFAGALWTGLRAALAVILVSWFWIAADWPHGSTATILGIVATARLATMGHAVPLAIAGTLIFGLSTIPAFIVVETLLPLASGFPMFALAVAPMLFLCAFLMAYERTMIIGYLSALLFASVGAFQDRMVYDPIGLINTSLAAVVAAAVAMVLWAVVAPESVEAARRRFDRTASRLLASIGRARRPIGAGEFETAMVEALERLRGALRPDRPADLATLDGGAALLIAGRELIHLRQDRRSSPATAVFESEFFAATARPGLRRLDRARDAARVAAERCLAELREPALGAEEAQAEARNIVAFTTVRDALERGRALLADRTTEAMRSNAA
jgi:uncharacterized membrane protein YccC